MAYKDPDYHKKWYKKNRKRIREQQKEYEKSWANKGLKKPRPKHNPLTYVPRVLANIKVYYGCSNPNCNWDGPLLPSQLDFHHIDRSEKRKPFLKLENAK